MRIACLVSGDQGLVPTELVNLFEQQNGLVTAEDEAVSVDSEADEDRAAGMDKKSGSKFLRFLVDNRAPLACQVFRDNYFKASLNSVQELEDYALPPGNYVVGVACELGVRHCFVLHVPSDASFRKVHDVPTKGREEDYTTEPLMNLAWIRQVIFVRRFERVRKMCRQEEKSGRIVEAYSQVYPYINAKTNEGCRY